MPPQEKDVIARSRNVKRNIVNVIVSIKNALIYVSARIV